MKFNRESIRAQIDLLIRQFPDLQDDDVLRADMIEGSTDLIAFLRQLERSRRDTVSYIIGLNSTIEEMKSRVERLKSREQNLRSLMRNLMLDAGVKKIELAEATLSLRPNQPRVIIVDDLLISDELCRFRREPDKIKLKAALDAGEVVEGAALSNPEITLSIRTK